jgi:hypothetical protein
MAYLYDYEKANKRPAIYIEYTNVTPRDTPERRISIVVARTRAWLSRALSMPIDLGMTNWPLISSLAHSVIPTSLDPIEATPLQLHIGATGH